MEAWVALGFGTKDRTTASRLREIKIAHACRQLGLGEKLAQKNDSENMPKQASIGKISRNSIELIVIRQPYKIRNSVFESDREVLA